MDIIPRPEYRISLRLSRGYPTLRRIRCTQSVNYTCNCNLQCVTDNPHYPAGRTELNHSTNKNTNVG